jgi:hypothetical protein
MLLLEMGVLGLIYSQSRIKGYLVCLPILKCSSGEKTKTLLEILHRECALSHPHKLYISYTYNFNILSLSYYYIIIL